MLIRTEIPVDAAKIDHLLETAFAGRAEADLVCQLREEGLLTLGVVATDDDGDVIGYAAFSPVSVMQQDLQWQALAPLAVAEKHRKKGIGKQLICEGLDTLNEFGYAAVVTLGDPDYYSQLGFKPASAYNLNCKWTGTESYFQIYVLNNNELKDINGLVSYSQPFERL